MLLVLGSSTMIAQTAIIVNNSVPSTTTFQVTDLMDVYTLNKTHWDDGSRITVFDLKGGKSKQAFYEHIGMSEDELQRIWLRKQFTGKARPPRSLSSEEEVLEQVRRIPGAIGYVNERAIGSKKNIRVVARIR
jgi:ABC-type phosphate transport system substrate-binding protein